MKYPKEKSVIITGVWLIIMPYLGIPRSFKSFLTVLSGIVLVYLGALILKQIRKTPKDNTEIAKSEKIMINM